MIVICQVYLIIEIYSRTAVSGSHPDFVADFERAVRFVKLKMFFTGNNSADTEVDGLRHSLIDAAGFDAGIADNKILLCAYDSGIQC